MIYSDAPRPSLPNCPAPFGSRNSDDPVRELDRVDPLWLALGGLVEKVPGYHFHPLVGISTHRRPFGLTPNPRGQVRGRFPTRLAQSRNSGRRLRGFRPEPVNFSQEGHGSYPY